MNVNKQKIKNFKHIYDVQAIQDSLQSSDHILVVQSPTVRKFLTKVGFLSRLITGPYCALNLVAIFSAGVLPLRFPDITIPKNIRYFYMQQT